MLSKLAMCCFSDFLSEKLFGIIPISYVVSFRARAKSLRLNILPRNGSTVDIESLPPSSKYGKIKFGFQSAFHEAFSYLVFSSKVKVKFSLKEIGPAELSNDTSIGIVTC